MLISALEIHRRREVETAQKAWTRRSSVEEQNEMKTNVLLDGNSLWKRTPCIIKQKRHYQLKQHQLKKTVNENVTRSVIPNTSIAA